MGTIVTSAFIGCLALLAAIAVAAGAYCRWAKG